MSFSLFFLCSFYVFFRFMALCNTYYIGLPRNISDYHETYQFTSYMELHRIVTYDI